MNEQVKINSSLIETARAHSEAIEAHNQTLTLYRERVEALEKALAAAEARMRIATELAAAALYGLCGNSQEFEGVVSKAVEAVSKNQDTIQIGAIDLEAVKAEVDKAIDSAREASKDG